MALAARRIGRRTGNTRGRSMRFEKGQTNRKSRRLWREKGVVIARPTVGWAD